MINEYHCLLSTSQPHAHVNSSEISCVLLTYLSGSSINELFELDSVQWFGGHCWQRHSGSVQPDVLQTYLGRWTTTKIDDIESSKFGNVGNVCVNAWEWMKVHGLLMITSQRQYSFLDYPPLNCWGVTMCILENMNIIDMCELCVNIAL